MDTNRCPRERYGRLADWIQEKLRSARECRRRSARGADTRPFHTAWALSGGAAMSAFAPLSGARRTSNASDQGLQFVRIRPSFDLVARPAHRGSAVDPISA